MNFSTYFYGINSNYDDTAYVLNSSGISSRSIGAKKIKSLIGKKIALEDSESPEVFEEVDTECKLSDSLVSQIKELSESGRDWKIIHAQKYESANEDYRNVTVLVLDKKADLAKIYDLYCLRGCLILSKNQFNELRLKFWAYPERKGEDFYYFSLNGSNLIRESVKREVVDPNIEPDRDISISVCEIRDLQKILGKKKSDEVIFS